MIRTALFLLVLVLVTACSSAPSSSILVGQKAPFTRFPLMDGTYKTTDNYQGQNLLLFFWATSCRHSYSVLEDAVEWLKENGRGKNIRIVSISVDKSSSEAKVNEVLRTPELKGMGIEHAFSGNDIYDEAYMTYDIGELPTLMLIDPEGKVIASGNSVSVLEDAFDN